MQIGVIGAGTMGAGIAQVAVMFQNQVIVVDANEVALQKASTDFKQNIQKLEFKGKITKEQVEFAETHIVWSSSFEDLKPCELVIEAIVENLDVKQKVFTEIEKIVSEECILASNTSSLSIASIASVCKKPERFIGIHFFNPATWMQLVEIIPALQTEDTIVFKSKQIIDSWNKITVIAKDTPGFIVNRIARPFYSESLRILDEGIANISTIDYALKNFAGFKMGPFELMDLIGHDVNYTVTETVWKSFYFDTKYTPSFTQKRLVEAKWLGRKSGRGFYNYQENAMNPEINGDEILCKKIVERVLAMLIHEAANALYLQIAHKEDIELAMTKGVNYPKGLFAWANEIGIQNVVATLDSLYEHYHEDRYRCTPLLRTTTLF